MAQKCEDPGGGGSPGLVEICSLLARENGSQNSPANSRLQALPHDGAVQ